MLLCLSSRQWWVLGEPVEVAGEVALKAAGGFAAGLAFLDLTQFSGGGSELSECSTTCSTPSVRSTTSSAVGAVRSRFRGFCRAL